MSGFINTIDAKGDDVVVSEYITREITEFYDDVITILKSYSFRSCPNLVKAVLPSVITVNSLAFCNCSSLTVVDFSKITSIGTNCFYDSNNLKALILRSTSRCKVNGDPIQKSGISSGKGYIYVPSALVSGYQSANCWSTYANQFRALEDYTVDGTITGELDETKI